MVLPKFQGIDRYLSQLKFLIECDYYFQLHILLEPLLWKKNNLAKVSDPPESVGAFLQRHFGKEVVDYLVDPFVAGTSGGDPESLSMRHAFPELWNLEKRYIVPQSFFFVFW
ncbi:protoporphyrinogen oxidase, mitochondrial-like [Olea europaea var. sylvestris]|uniref:protoporphyrinogen oxidase, mitochondrial-like n=1 Tax=Olea europaea var. sylvestris TaxID=158386 RepID=UPI000C1CD37E|nr:protoporphyrinogen oxidase, mitochondrial-like [Olea europaea var. sylvestris]